MSEIVNVLGAFVCFVLCVILLIHAGGLRGAFETLQDGISVLIDGRPDPPPVRDHHQTIHQIALLERELEGDHFVSEYTKHLAFCTDVRVNGVWRKRPHAPQPDQVKHPVKHEHDWDPIYELGTRGAIAVSCSICGKYVDLDRPKPKLPYPTTKGTWR